MKLPESWTEDCAELLRAFNKEGVEYLIFGSMAKSHYRSVARVSDMDVLLPAGEPPEWQFNPNATKVKSVLDSVVFRICGSLPNLTVEDLAKPGRRLDLGSFCRSYLKVDLFTAKREFDFCEAFSRSIAVAVVDGIPAQVASEGDLKILDSLTAAP